jgi:uncharacterized protein (DUF362 family)
MKREEITVEKPYCVRAVHCDHRASDEEVYQALKRATDPLDGAWEKLRRARRIGIKFNQDKPPHRLVVHEGNHQQIVSASVMRATLRLLRERTKAELFHVDTPVESPQPGVDREACTQALPYLREFGVPHIDGTKHPVAWVDVPGGGQLFRKYPVPEYTVDADAFVSVQKLKSHAFMGITLCLKNLFGIVPLHYNGGRPRHYYHHLVRMPYMLADLGRIFNPALNIIDGLVSQTAEEWEPGNHPRVCDTLVAGDQVIATDACGATLMGHDPQSDWLVEPFHRDRNALLVAAEGGFGTVDLHQIDFASEVQSPVGHFFAKKTDLQETVVSWRRTTAEQGLYYLDHQKEIIEKHAGEYVLLQMGEVRWSDKMGDIRVSRRQLSGEHPDQAMWLKYVDPDEPEGEHFEVYEKTLEQIRALAV